MAKRFLIGTLVIMAMIVFVFGLKDSAAKTVNLQFHSGSTGGIWYVGGAAISDYVKKINPSINITVLPASAIGNIKLLDAKETDIAISSGVWCNLGMKGEAPFEKKHPSPRAICVLDGGIPSAYIAMLVRSNTGIKSVKQIIEQKYPLKLCVTTKGSASEYVARQVLTEYGLTYDAIKSWGGKVNYSSHTEAVTLIRDGHANAWFFLSALGHGPTTELVTARNMTFLPMDTEIVTSMVSNYGHTAFTVPANSFKNQTKEIPTVGVGAILLVRSDLPDDIAYTITKAVCTNADKLKQTVSAFPLDPSTAWKHTQYPLHPGAEKWYKENGLIK